MRWPLTGFGPGTASYRWRYRGANSEHITVGTGQARESFERKIQSDGKYILVPKADHDPVVRAGDLSIEWSYGGATNGWLYYCASRAIIQILPADGF